MGASYIVNRSGGAVKVYFDEMWDGVDRYFNPDTPVEVGWDVSGSGTDFEYTHEGFELLIPQAQVYDVYKLCGYMPEISDNPNFSVLTIGNYYNVPGSQTVLSGATMCYNGTITDKNGDHHYDGLTPYFVEISPPLSFVVPGGVDNEAHYSFNFPIFKTLQARDNYIRDGVVEDCWNYGSSYDLDYTEYYHIYNKQQQGSLYNGKITPTSSDFVWHSLRFSANKKPTLYFDENFELKLQAPEIVASKAVTGPGYIIDNIPEESWTEGSLEYSGPFYGTLAAKLQYTGTLPENGNYMFGADVNTNIPIFKTKAEADYALASGDYSAAGNYYNLEEGNTHQPIEIGDAEASTTFGSGYATSPFVTSYVMDRNAVINIANIFYTNDATLIDNIKKGLELFGASPYDAICGLSWFPFSLNQIVGASTQPYIYFGSYQHTGVSVDKVINLKQTGYINAGSFYVKPLFGSYRDFEPYCRLSVYLPYSGWHELDIAKYYKKTVNVRYYVDIYTNTFACALVAEGQIVDVFNGNIGSTLPVSGTNMSEYANSMLRAVLGTVGGTAGGALTGAMVMPGPVGAVAGAAIGGFAGIAKGTFEMSQKGKPRDHAQVKGAFSGNSAAYMPQYVVFRYDVHNLIVPANLTALQGRPSSAGGKIGAFSGFLKCDTIKLNTGRMTDPEISEVLSLLKEGIFV